MAGVRLQDLNPDVGNEGDPENWEDLHKEVINRSVSQYNCLQYYIFLQDPKRQLLYKIINRLCLLLPFMAINAYAIWCVKHSP